MLICVLSVFCRGRGTVDALLRSENSLCACAIVHPSIYGEGCTIAQHYHKQTMNTDYRYQIETRKQTGQSRCFCLFH